MLDPVEFGKSMAQIVNDAVTPLIKRIEELEAREPIKGEDGKSVTPEDVAPMIQEEVAKAVAQIPPAKDGESVTVDDVAPMIAEQVKAAVESIPKPKDGKDGKDGRDGKDADPIEIDLEDITRAVLQAPEAIEAAVNKHLEANPPAPGKDGVGMAGASIDRDGNLILTLTNGETKELGRVVGKDGENGKDGVGLAGASISRDGELVVTLSSGEQKSLGPVVGRDGKDGADFSGVEFDYDGERTITIKGRGGEITKRVPVPLDRGYWREGMACEKGDIVTENGTAWIALRDTKAKPALENKEDWRIFARKGRDGRDGKNGIDKTAPAKVAKKDEEPEK